MCEKSETLHFSMNTSPDNTPMPRMQTEPPAGGPALATGSKDSFRAREDTSQKNRAISAPRYAHTAFPSSPRTEGGFDDNAMHVASRSTNPCFHACSITSSYGFACPCTYSPARSSTGNRYSSILSVLLLFTPTRVCAFSKLKFDSSLGYPGEGPSRIMTWNGRGLCDRRVFADALKRARASRISRNVLRYV